MTSSDECNGIGNNLVIRIGLDSLARHPRFTLGLDTVSIFREEGELQEKVLIFTVEISGVVG